MSLFYRDRRNHGTAGRTVDTANAHRDRQRVPAHPVARHVEVDLIKSDETRDQPAPLDHHFTTVPGGVAEEHFQGVGFGERLGGGRPPGRYRPSAGDAEAGGTTRPAAVAPRGAFRSHRRTIRVQNRGDLGHWIHKYSRGVPGDRYTRGGGRRELTHRANHQVVAPGGHVRWHLRVDLAGRGQQQWQRAVIKSDASYADQSRQRNVSGNRGGAEISSEDRKQAVRRDLGQVTGDVDRAVWSDGGAIDSGRRVERNNAQPSSSERVRQGPG